MVHRWDDFFFQFMTKYKCWDIELKVIFKLEKWYMSFIQAHTDYMKLIFLRIMNNYGWWTLNTMLFLKVWKICGT